MQRIARLFCLITTLAASLCAQVRQLGRVDVVVDTGAIPVRVSANVPALSGLAQTAFDSHGLYKVRGSDYVYDIRFTSLGGNQVRVDVTKGRQPAPFFSQTVGGTSARNALLRAADLAVVQTNGKGLRGYFTGRLAFVAEGTGKQEIYTSDLFGGELRRLTSDRAYSLSPKWSPDGSRIVYTSYLSEGAPDIFMIDMRSYRRHDFARYRGTNTGARFSPDGQQVAMVLSGTGSPEIYVGSASGGAPLRKTHSDLAKSSPCWSPDGGRLVFAMEPGPQLFVMSAMGGGLQRLRVGYTYAAEPDWSRTDPNKIACTVRPPGAGYRIGVYDLSKGQTNVVSTKDFDSIEPTWLADGRHLVYTARDRHKSVLCILDTETGKSTPLPIPVGSAMQANVLFGN